MPKVDFSSVMGGAKKKDTEPKPKKAVKKPVPAQTIKPASVQAAQKPAPSQAAKKPLPAQPAKKPRPAQPAKKPVPVQRAKKPTAVKKRPVPKLSASARALEKEIRSFEKKPKPAREKASEKFDFKNLTSKIREKAVKPAGESPAPKPAGRAVAGQKPGASPQEAKRPHIAKRVVSKIKEKVFNRHSIQRVPTGINGLDGLIEGGFEKGSSVLLVGSSGTGKTLFAQQFLYYGAKDHNEPGIFISFEEERETLYKHSSSFGWDFEALEKKGLFKVLEYKPHQVEKLMQEGGGTIKDQIRAMGAKRLVIDSITSYALLFKDEYQKRENILEFFDMLGKWGCTSIIISELPPRLAEIKEGSVGFLTDAIISLYYSKDTEKGIRVHSCEILKMRGTKHTNKMLALGFEKDGLVIYPEVEVF